VRKCHALERPGGAAPANFHHMRVDDRRKFCSFPHRLMGEAAEPPPSRRSEKSRSGWTARMSPTEVAKVMPLGVAWGRSAGLRRDGLGVYMEVDGGTESLRSWAVVYDGSVTMLRGDLQPTRS
jgi:hypothetical protein